MKPYGQKNVDHSWACDGMGLDRKTVRALNRSERGKVKKQIRKELAGLTLHNGKVMHDEDVDCVTYCCEYHNQQDNE